MHVRDAVAGRFSCRAFLDKPVPAAVVRDLLARAARAPSGSNIQPWRVDVLAGPALAALKDLIRPRLGELPKGEGTEYQVFPPAMHEPFRSRRFAVGEQLYRSLGIAREDRPARLAQYSRNMMFFDAPVGLFFSIDRALGAAQWADLGMFMQTFMLLAHAEGLATCAQEAWAVFSRTVSAFLDLPDDHILFCGMALGYADHDALINSWRTTREPVERFATFRGFEG